MGLDSGGMRDGCRRHRARIVLEAVVHCTHVVLDARTNKTGCRSKSQALFGDGEAVDAAPQPRRVTCESRNAMARRLARRPRCHRALGVPNQGAGRCGRDRCVLVHGVLAEVTRRRADRRRQRRSVLVHGVLADATHRRAGRGSFWCRTSLRRIGEALKPLPPATTDGMLFWCMGSFANSQCCPPEGKCGASHFQGEQRVAMSALGVGRRRRALATVRAVDFS